MAMIEQNISGVKLEKLRKKAVKKTKFLKKMPKFVFVICLLLAMLKPRNIGLFLILTSGEGLDLGTIAIGIVMILGEVLLAFCIAAAAMGFYLLLSWKKTYNAFNDNYKNKYVLLKIREVPGFSNLKYAAKQGITYDELLKANLLPGRAKSFYESGDYFEGAYEGIHFRASSVKTYEPDNSALTIFDGQVIVFPTFHAFKTSETAIQIFPKKQGGKMKGLTFREKVETENEAFNNMFSVYAENGHNAFYILTPQVLEDILEFAKIIQNHVYIVFSDQSMYLGCEQMHNPFNAVVDIPVEEQSGNIAMATEVIRKAKEMLIHIENQS